MAQGITISFGGQPYTLQASTGKYGILVPSATLATTGASSFTPAFFQNFDALTPGSAPGFNAFDFTTVSNAQSFSSPNSAVSTVTSGGGNFGASQALSFQPTVGDEVWFRFRVLFPVGFNFNAPGNGHLKFMRIDTGPIAGGTHAHLDLYIAGGGLNTPGFFDWIYEATSTWLFGGGGTTPVATGITQGSWNTFEIYYKLGLTAGTSTIRVWRDLTPIIDTSNNLPTGVVNQLTLGGSNYIVGASNQASGGGGGYMWSTYWNGGSPITQSAWMDDFTVAIASVSRPPNTDVNGNKFIGSWHP